MQYIRTHETETLVKLYPALEGMAQSTRAQMNNIKGSGVTDDDVLGMALPHRDFEDIPASYSQGVISDKTAKTALNYETSLSLEVQEALKELRSELLLITLVLDKIHIALTTLTKDQREIIQLKYWEGLVWSEVADKFMISASNAKGQGKRAIEWICKVSRITVDTYESIMKLFN